MSNHLLSIDHVEDDVLGYLHPERVVPHLDLSSVTLCQRSVINDMLLHDLDLITLERPMHAIHPWVRHWALLPSVAVLIGACLMKPELSRGGIVLRLPHQVRAFLATVPYPVRDERRALGCPREIQEQLRAPGGPGRLLQWLQAIGFRHLLDWQPQSSPALVARLRLLFPPGIATTFDQRLKPQATVPQLLILQAIHHAKNHPDIP